MPGFDTCRVRVRKPLSTAVSMAIDIELQALTNGRYKSCLHRAVVNRERERRSLVFFVCPREDRIVRPPPDLLGTDMEVPRKYPDFTWSDLLEFTQNHYRTDVATLQSFIHWLLSPNPKSLSLWNVHLIVLLAGQFSSSFFLIFLY